jgi:hypothetical protein
MRFSSIRLQFLRPCQINGREYHGNCQNSQDFFPSASPLALALYLPLVHTEQHQMEHQLAFLVDLKSADFWLDFQRSKLLRGFYG